MGISDRKALTHIEKWTERLSKVQSLSYRSNWPRYLFRHEPLENAALIIKASSLLSRRDAENIEHTDIAPSSVIAARDDAHSFGRLYFRPKNPTQYRVEGIRKDDEPYLEQSAHAPMLVMFLFSARSVLTMEDTHFSSGNMQSHGTVFDKSEEFFDQIDFGSVFHDSAFLPEEKAKIINARCTEVLVKSPLDLRVHLKGILCRSQAEKQTLLHLGGKAAREIRDKIRVYSEVGIFENRYTFVKAVELTPVGLKIELNPRLDGREIEVTLTVKNIENGKVWYRRDKPHLTKGDKNLVRDQEVEDGTYSVKIWLEGKLAFDALITVDSFPF